MTALVDLSGQRYGRLLVVQRVAAVRPVAWRCRCDCGKHKDVRSGQLRSGKTRSCGCIAMERIARLRRSHGKSGTPEYKIWKDIKKRCRNPNHAAYRLYGGRGIAVAPEWEDSFESFLSAVGSRPSPAHSIDRIDNSKGYQPGNVRWATQPEQNRNTRQNRRLTHNGRTMTLTDWASEVGINSRTLWSRVAVYGWSTSDALTRPAGRSNRKSLSPADNTTG